MTTYRRATRETQITLALALGSTTTESVRVATGEPFLDHMVITLARYAGLQLEVAAAGDLRHHLIEDVAITLGLALKDAIPAACRRYGHTVLPMDDALVEAAVDVGGRSYYEGRLPSSLYEHFLRSLAENAGITLHLRVLRGRDPHHVVEAAFKASALALRQAIDATQEVFSTKGAVKIEREEQA
jgi:imidazoleglycerol-phosphate dehydratase